MAGVLPATLRVALRSKIAPGDFVNIIFTSILLKRAANYPKRTVILVGFAVPERQLKNKGSGLFSRDI